MHLIEVAAHPDQDATYSFKAIRKDSGIANASYRSCCTSDLDATYSFTAIRKDKASEYSNSIIFIEVAAYSNKTQHIRSQHIA